MVRKRINLRVGDVFEIPLSDARRAYGQYVFDDRQMGPMIQVFDLITEQSVQVDELRNAKPLFPPVFTGLYAALREGLWTIIGHLSIGHFSYPQFISPQYVGKEGDTRNWYLWDGERYTFLGRELPKGYQHLEQLVGWSPYDISKRIETGKDPLAWRLDLQQVSARAQQLAESKGVGPDKSPGLKVGDVFEIPLSDGRRAYGQYVFYDEEHGNLFQVFDLVTEERGKVEQLSGAKPLFAPIVVDLAAIIALGDWALIGHIPVEGFTYPKFLEADYDYDAQKVRAWYLWDGEEFVPLGPNLSDEYKHLEMLFVWDAYDVVERIETGVNPHSPEQYC